jgi:hypothetical protein
MSDSPQSSNVIFLKKNSVVPTNIRNEQADPTRDPAWVLWACMFYGPENADPNEAYEELAERDRQHGIAS